MLAPFRAIIMARPMHLQVLCAVGASGHMSVFKPVIDFLYAGLNGTLPRQCLASPTTFGPSSVLGYMIQRHIPGRSS
jgi:hypothetical protein